MLEHLTGEDGPLWEACPNMRLVMLATIPSGDPQIMRIRDEIIALQVPPDLPMQTVQGNPSIRHVHSAFHKYSSPLVYVGYGSTDCQGRPSQYANPYLFSCTEPEEALLLYREYLDSRADLEVYLHPLQSAELVCDCRMGLMCHTYVLLEYIQMVFGPAVEDMRSSKYDALNEACVLEGFEEDDDAGENMPVPKFNAEVEAVNETVRSGIVKLHNSNPGWLPSWER